MFTPFRSFQSLDCQAEQLFQSTSPWMDLLCISPDHPVAEAAPCHMFFCWVFVPFWMDFWPESHVSCTFPLILSTFMPCKGRFQQRCSIKVPFYIARSDEYRPGQAPEGSRMFTYTPHPAARH